VPTRQFAELLWASAGGGPWPSGAVLVLGCYTLLFGTLAWLGWRRDEGEKFR
jgi:hypothetical protein